MRRRRKEEHLSLQKKKTLTYIKQIRIMSIKVFITDWRLALLPSRNKTIILKQKKKGERKRKKNQRSYYTKSFIILKKRRAAMRA